MGQAITTLSPGLVLTLRSLLALSLTKVGGRAHTILETAQRPNGFYLGLDFGLGLVLGLVINKPESGD